VPNFREVCSIIDSEGLKIDFSTRRHRPRILMIGGLILEPVSSMSNRIIPGFTTAYYGFEPVVWASRR
jgi:hypothetical protein